MASNCVIVVFLITSTYLSGGAKTAGDFGKRDRSHIEDILKVLGNEANENKSRNVLEKLHEVYIRAIKPLEQEYNFNGLNTHVLSDGDILSMPTIVLFGAWSVGKTSMINYLLNRELDTHLLEVGAQPTTTDFTIIQYGEDRLVEGSVLAMEKKFSDLEQFGKAFLGKLQGVNINCSLLKKFTLIDTPGIIENRKQQERGYPFNEVSQWFINKADLIFVIFDPTKLDVGQELEKLFVPLKGHEGKIRIILNKADTVSTQELMRLYGALFWGLAPLMNIVEPPRVYIGSFWSKAFKNADNEKLFFEEEKSLVKDMFTIMVNNIENKIALTRQHAILVRNHAITVDSYKQVFYKHASLMLNNDKLMNDIVSNPSTYQIFKTLISHQGIGKHYTPDPQTYKKFFQTYNLKSFNYLPDYCGFFTECPLKILEKAIEEDLPRILSSNRDCSNEAQSRKTKTNNDEL